MPDQMVSFSMTLSDPDFKVTTFFEVEVEVEVVLGTKFS